MYTLPFFTAMLGLRRKGTVTATGRNLYKGRTTMVWDINIVDEENILVSSIRCTVEIVDRPLSDPQEIEAKMKAMSEWDSFIDLPRFW
jgi:hypothetical protein